MGGRPFALVATTHVTEIAMISLMGRRAGEKEAKGLVVSLFLPCPMEQIFNL